MATGLFRTATMAAGVALAAFALGAGTAGAVSDRVRTSCSNDYFKFCPSHAVGSASLRQCMRQVGSRLSPRCIDALVASGEIKRTARR
jgi:hypothetical protein